jgi:hypothetical protein
VSISQWTPGPWRLLRRIAAFAVGLLLGCTAAAAWAGVDQTGRITDSTAIDGSSSVVYGEAFNARPGTCVLYANLVVTVTGSRQVEGGVLRCDGATIDGTCHND